MYIQLLGSYFLQCVSRTGVEHEEEGLVAERRSLPCTWWWHRYGVAAWDMEIGFNDVDGRGVGPRCDECRVEVPEGMEEEKGWNGYTNK